MESKEENWSVPASDSSKTEEKSLLQQLREWLDALVFAMVVASLVRWFFFEPFTIPTPSMEKSLLVGDYLFVSKLHYGARTPKTLLQIPLTHQKIWGTEKPSYLDWIQLPQFRLPGFSEVKKGDCVVFNWPGDSLYPSDLRTNYIKRCVATPGDVIEIRKRQIFINGKPQDNPAMLQYKYWIASSIQIEPSYMKGMEINNYDDAFPKPNLHDPIQFFQDPQSGLYVYCIHMSPEQAEKLKKVDFIKNLEISDPMEEHPGMVYAYNPANKWNEDRYGPLTIPKEGMTIKLDDEAIRRYYPVIKRYEDNDKVELRNSQVYVDGKLITEYTFKQDYYWMMGDNRHNSLDSRFWGFVPEDHVVGKAWFVWLSIDPDNDFVLDGIRWKRIFNLVD
jgi:signal peptidase I